MFWFWAGSFWPGFVFWAGFWFWFWVLFWIWRSLVPRFWLCARSIHQPVLRYHFYQTFIYENVFRGSVKRDVTVMEYDNVFCFWVRTGACGSAAEVKGHERVRLWTQMNWISSDGSFFLLAISSGESRQIHYLGLLFIYNTLQKAKFRHWSCLEVLTSDVLVHQIPSLKIALSWILIWKVTTLVAISIEFQAR